MQVITTAGFAAEWFPPTGIYPCACGVEGIVWAREGTLKDAHLVAYCDRCVQARARVVAERRAAQYQAQGDHFWVGLVGEIWFAREMGLPVNFVNGQGDGGRDFLTPGGKWLDVKTSRMQPPTWPLPATPRADAYVLVTWTGYPVRLGFSWARVVFAEEIRAFTDVNLPVPNGKDLGSETVGRSLVTAPGLWASVVQSHLWRSEARVKAATETALDEARVVWCRTGNTAPYREAAARYFRRDRAEIDQYFADHAAGKRVAPPPPSFFQRLRARVCP